MYIFVYHLKYQKILLSSVKESSKTHSSSSWLSKLVEDSVRNAIFLYVIFLSKISSSAGCSKGSIVEKGSSWSKEEVISFSAVEIKWLYNSISQLVWIGLSFESNFISSAFFPVSNCFIASKLYHSANFFFMKALALLLIVKCKSWKFVVHWNKLVILAGTFTYFIWFSASLAVASVVTCPLKTSRISNAGWNGSIFHFHF